MKLTVNLNGNFLCPFQIFIDISKQIPNSLSISEVFTPICELNTINDWINLESLGNPAALRAKALNKKLQHLLDSNGIDAIELHMESLEGVLTIDNLYSLLFLSDSLSALKLFFYVKADKKEQLKKKITPLVEKKNVELNYNAPGLAGVALLEENRYKILQNIGFDFNCSWMSNPLSQANASKLIGYAWLCLKSGAYEIGTWTLSLALERSDLTEAIREQLLMHLQLTRFLSHQYEAVTQAQFPESFQFLKQDDAISLHFIKAYSATLTRNLDVAASHFRKCQVNEHLPLTDENSLYRLNLYALFLALQNKTELAMTLERRIKDYIKCHEINVVGLKYVNFINIARLHKKSQQYDRAFTYYRLAYREISGGGYTPSDRIYYNMNMGSLHEAAGNFESALFFWIKAALHWLSFDDQYALSWRPRLILCQEKITDILTPLSIDKANQFLYEKISHLIEKVKIQLIDSNQSSMQFLIEDAQVLAKETCYIAKNIILYASSESKTIAANNKLNTLVSRFIKQAMNIQNSHHSLIVDTQNEEYYPKSLEECISLAAVAQCSSCYYQGEPLDDEQALIQQLKSVSSRGRLETEGKSRESGLLDQVGIQLAPAITEISQTSTGLLLRYNRSFLNKKIELQEERAFVLWLERERKINFSQLDATTMKTFFTLLNKKVVVIAYPSLQYSEHEMNELAEYI